MLKPILASVILLGALSLAAAPAAAQAPYLAIGKYEEPSPGRRDPSPDLQAQYDAAVQDAATAEPGEIAVTLSPVVPWNPELIWSDDGPASRVLVVTWTSWGGYGASVGTTTTLGRDVWVTPAPAIQDFIARERPADAALRVEQLLGLPPANGKTLFVEFWADPQDLFRPAPDPEISDREAGVDYPVSPRFVTVAPAHADWIDALTAISYGDGGYPWTRLGYTYDWGHPTGEVGLSEYVISAGAVVGVESVTSTSVYLELPPPGPASAWRLR